MNLINLRVKIGFTHRWTTVWSTCKFAMPGSLQPFFKTTHMRNTKKTLCTFNGKKFKTFFIHISAHILLPCFNAKPTYWKSETEALETLNGRRKVFVLVDFFIAQFACSQSGMILLHYPFFSLDDLIISASVVWGFNKD